MVKYGLTWWKARIYWRLSRFFGYLMTPCVPMKAVSWIDRHILRRWCLLKFYDTWTMRLSVIFHGRWANLVYGPDRRRG